MVVKIIKKRDSLNSEDYVFYGVKSGRRTPLGKWSKSSRKMYWYFVEIEIMYGCTAYTSLFCCSGSSNVERMAKCPTKPEFERLLLMRLSISRTSEFLINDDASAHTFEASQL